MEETRCNLREQGHKPGSCTVRTGSGNLPACQATLHSDGGSLSRMIASVHLSRPEHYLSVYQSGCNLSCRKCHSWEFSQIARGSWYTPEDLLQECLEYSRRVTLVEPRERATSWHAQSSCRGCGSCVVKGKRSGLCPEVLDREAVLASPQGFGPARNIVGFTGGDLACRPEFYEECARLIKEHTDLWVLMETNGCGLTEENLQRLQNSGVDSFWLDIKAHDPGKQERLTGCSNQNVLSLPERILSRGFTLEVLSLYIPGLVEEDELERIADLLAAVDPGIPFTILAFFPEYQMKHFRSPTAPEMLQAYHRARSAGLEKIRLGNLGVCIRSEEDEQLILQNIDPEAL